MTNNTEIALAYNFVRNTDKSIFLTGKAGTGKTTFLHRVKAEIPKRMVIVAPTGVAAINAGGVTIHSFFQMPFGPIVPGMTMKEEKQKMTKRKIDMIRALDMVVIDEVSMVRADLLDGIDQVLKRYRRNDKPFGGVQMLLIGDLQQLPPVARQEEWSLLSPHYATPYFFSAKAYQQANAIGITLKKVYRQSDRKFLSILEEIRNNIVHHQTLKQLNERYDPEFANGEHKGYITLSTHNASANRINNRELDKIPGKAKVFKATITGTFPGQNYPTEEELMVKVGAQVMFIKNDPTPEKLYYNGKIGTVSRIENNTIWVKDHDSDKELECARLEWENKRYSINEKNAEIKEDVIGTFRQYPLRLAWAITIHKSQGLTFDKVIIDAEAAFAHGQTYVALSRCRTLEGIVLSSHIDERGIISDYNVSNFTQNIELNPPTEESLDSAKNSYQRTLLEELFLFDAIDKKTGYLLNTIRKNVSPLTGNLEQTILEIRQNPLRHASDTGKKFIAEIRHHLADSPDAEKNAVLQERLKKGGIYFGEIIKKQFSEPLAKASWDTDNSNYLKQLSNILFDLEDLIDEKNIGFDVLKNGFSVSELLERKARNIVKKEGLPKKKRKPLPQSENPVLYRRIIEWRNKKADDSNLHNYMIASLELIISISNELPIAKTHLLLLPGLGKKRVDKYGDEIIAMVQEYCLENGIEPGEEPEPKAIKKARDKKAMKGESAKQSYELYNKGLSIEEIAIARDLKPSTIGSHLLPFLKNGDVDIFRLIDEEKYKLVEKYIAVKPDATLTEAKADLTDDLSYEDIRFAIAAIKKD